MPRPTKRATRQPRKRAASARRQDRGKARPARRSREAEEPAHTKSPSAVAGEAWRTGVTPNVVPPRPEDIPGEDEMRVGDPDLDVLGNTYVGDQAPGGSTTTPDQDSVDQIGRAVGVQEADSGALRTSSEVLDERDRHRARQERPDTRDRGRS
jgi:Family of unknown function (DUF6335)